MRVWIPPAWISQLQLQVNQCQAKGKCFLYIEAVYQVNFRDPSIVSTSLIFYDMNHPMKFQNWNLWCTCCIVLGTIWIPEVESCEAGSCLDPAMTPAGAQCSLESTSLLGCRRCQLILGKLWYQNSKNTFLGWSTLYEIIHKSPDSLNCFCCPRETGDFDVGFPTTLTWR